ncbi:MAG: hypothetical protein RL662_2493 [Bacteroidota bacterium]|jgi:predicted Zn-dependent protease
MRIIYLCLASALLLLSGCGSVPVTGRKQMLLVSDQEVLTLSLQEYGEFMKTAPKSTNKANTALVQKVGRNIANAVESYLKANGMQDLVSEYAWEFNLVKSADVNAFCMPGGKIVVYEGILPVTQDETGLAVVLGHEVAHAVAKHANERMSQQVLQQYGSGALGMVLDGKSAAVQTIASSVYGLGTQYGMMLPYSRKQELEADKLGLIFMSMADYNPQMAEGFWVRMSQKSGGAGVAEFMSTHPSDDTRIQKIRESLPDAMKYYKGGSSAKSAKTSEKWSF